MRNEGWDALVKVRGWEGGKRSAAHCRGSWLVARGAFAFLYFPSGSASARLEVEAEVEVEVDIGAEVEAVHFSAQRLVVARRAAPRFFYFAPSSY